MPLLLLVVAKYFDGSYQTANQKLLQAQQDLTLLRHEIAVALDLDFVKVVASTDLYKIYHPRA
jgi:hypothetical protein